MTTEDPQGGAPAAGPQGAQDAPPTEEELRAAFEEQMRRITVEDVIVQTALTLVNLGGRKLGLPSQSGEREEPDPAQARQAIEGLRALAPLLPADVAGPVKQALSQLQMAFAREARGGGEAPGAAGEAPAAAGEAAGGRPAPGTAPDPGSAPAPGSDEAERAKARSKIWTPPGT